MADQESDAAATSQPSSFDSSPEIGSGGQPAAFGAIVIGLAIVAIGTLISLLASTGGESDPGVADQLVIDGAGSTPSTPTATFDASIGDQPDIGRSISVTDEPIVIDADGEIVDPEGGNGTDTLPSQAGSSPDLDVADLDVPDDAYTGSESGVSTSGDGGQGSNEGAAQDAADETSAGAADDDTDDGLNLLGGDDPEDKRMPDLICRGLQAAQDEIQDRGVFGSKSEDATGRGRRQLWDRNWVVVAQDPAPGNKIGEFEAVLYVVKKSDDENICD